MQAMQRRRRKPKKIVCQRGSKNKLSPQITRVAGHYEEAISVLAEVPYLPDSCHAFELARISLGLAFLYNNLWLCKNSEEALYSIARAFDHAA
ncbi:hypothetical protein GBA52_000735 [Prunus armeniaca]|nr:hypothetical protein GBA52_000735 [Prunus armeniaca]